ncbi:MAG TPA: hypothetical protein VMS98_10925 [Thermoanaerobaculia bacterium]|nr:hypothetical protein [Thermoanaerobaculia bacterium]
MFRAIVAAALLSTTAQAFASDLRAEFVRRLPDEIGPSIRDVAWRGRDTLLFATNQGVYSYTLAAPGRAARVLPAVPIPDGVREPRSIDTDDTLAIVTSPMPPSGYVWETKGNERVIAQTSAELSVSQSAIFGKTLCIMAANLRATASELKSGSVWCGNVEQGWSTFKPVHRIRSGDAAVDRYRRAILHHGGSIARAGDGSFYVVTAAEPGVFHYSTAGRLLDVTGNNLEDLVLTDMRDLAAKFGMDIENRYRLMLNTQPTIDDLVVTPEGPAILVRLAEKNKIRWELWYPDRAGGAKRRVRLAADRPGPYGHLRCDARGDMLACIGSLPPANEANVVEKAQRHPTVWVFKLKEDSGVGVAAK